MLPRDPVAAVRRFNRFYTRRIGALDEAHLGSPYTLAEMRVLYEVAQAPDGITPKLLATRTGMDNGYLSRVLKRFEREGLLTRQTSERDRRSVSVWLTSEGIHAYNRWLGSAQGAVEGMLGALTTVQKTKLTKAMAEIEQLLEAPAAGKIVLRGHRPGDIGWVIHRHGALYAREYGWDERFEALVAQIAADFVNNFDPGRERCWIVEREGEILGSIFLVKGERPGQAKLRLLLVEPAARGLGLGKRLVAECVAFAREAGYDEITLWTQSILGAARAVYAGAGFELVESRPDGAFAKGLISETWVLKLEGAAAG
ncbi:DNA-binding MarR family transcriptional regulator/GNAT superfamily N-acetyltransferase [Phenylobacterium haematophilum]|uniref:DNA-binding MarR family transcriptional regulator/GNAT superfamily N-acetyltransferase n=1 Tax=Phenylobacterium haematophilum TaxID=98513 RepID=A0A839ZWU0_9CAUL|nr:bifunctional helix-turn-helix transcriptional regulator/GNAT family N-acetyltransferase [Phenylobacterium haematophilum]MBB3890528.1 DNA-binding MarR family transcriptional regulator/GNAT superfamily N-acetyltransferase [Phenylobacterium haematophilum]